MLRGYDAGEDVALGCSRKRPFTKGHLTSDFATDCLCHGQTGKVKGRRWEPVSGCESDLGVSPSRASMLFCIKVKLRKCFLFDDT